MTNEGNGVLSDEPVKISAGTGTASGVSTAVAVGQSLRPLADDNPCFAEIGKIVAEAARIEFLLDQTIAYVRGVDRAAFAYSAGKMTGVGQQFVALRKACQANPATSGLVERIKEVSSRADDAFYDRNRVVHDPWLEDSQSGDVFQIRTKSKDGSALGGVSVPIEDLTDILATLRAYRSELETLVSELWKALS